MMAFESLERLISEDLMQEDFQRFADLINSCYEMLEEMSQK